MQSFAVLIKLSRWRHPARYSCHFYGDMQAVDFSAVWHQARLGFGVMIDDPRVSRVAHFALFSHGTG